MGKEAQMRSFLNSLLSEEYGEIKSVTFENVEVLSDRKGGRGVIFDLYCATDSQIYSFYCIKIEDLFVEINEIYNFAPLKK